MRGGLGVGSRSFFSFSKALVKVIYSFVVVVVFFFGQDVFLIKMEI